MSEPDDLLLVHTTCADAEQARKLGAALVERRLAACASTGATLSSTYPWDGELRHDEETPLTLKTTRGAFDALSAVLQDLHPYEVPEVLATPVVGASSEFAAWVRDWVAGDDR